jgi:predicted membrane metal-binding protein
MWGILMSRRVVIALVVGVVLVALGFWGVTLLLRGPADPVIGKWRADLSPGCDAGATFLIVTSKEIYYQAPGEPKVEAVTVIGIETDGDARRLRVRYRDNAPGFDMLAPFRIVDDTLSFGNIDWTPEARAKYGPDIEMLERAMGESDIGNMLLAQLQPYHRCPA